MNWRRRAPDDGVQFGFSKHAHRRHHMILAPYLSSHCISAINRSLSLRPLLCMDGFFLQDLANHPVGYTSYIETLKLTSQHTHTHTHTHTLHQAL